MELYRRLAFPFACLVFALVAVPIGAQPRRGGRAAGSLIAVAMIAGYYLLFVTGAGLARQGTVPPAIGIWMANLILAAFGIILLPRMEQFRGESRWLHPTRLSSELCCVFSAVKRARAPRRFASSASPLNGSTRLNGNSHQPVPGGSIPRLLDIYILRRFTVYFAAHHGRVRLFI